MSETPPLLSVCDLSITYRSRAGTLPAVRTVSFDLAEGEALGLVGESGCGKSSIGKAIARIVEFQNGMTSGSIRFRGHEVTELRGKRLREFRRRVQIIFQDPIASLNPRRRIGELVEEGLVIAGQHDARTRRERVRSVVAEVGLDPDAVLDRYPHEFSGGQCQRISIARALILEPELLICDEPVSALDVSVQAQILNLLEDLRKQRRLSMLFISHDMAVVKNISDRTLVMYLGKTMEWGPGEQICSAPRHPYTNALLAAVPTLETGATARPDYRLAGEMPSPARPPSGCPLHARCPRALAECVSEWPARAWAGPDHWLYCHNPLPAESEAAPALSS